MLWIRLAKLTFFAKVPIISSQSPVFEAFLPILRGIFLLIPNKLRYLRLIFNKNNYGSKD
jgi:hypothetical protein